MKLKTSKSYINKSIEGVAPQKTAAKITHWLYFFIIISIATYFAYSVYLAFMTFDGVGHVKVNKTLLSSNYDGKIIQLTIKEEEKVEKGALLVQLKPATSCQAKEVKQDSRIAQLEYAQQLKQIKIELLSNQISSLNQLDNKQILRRALELVDRHLRNRQKNQSLGEELILLTRELVLERDLLKKLKKLGVTNGCPDELIYAPFDGTIKRVFFGLNEFSSRGKGIVLIQPDQASVLIEAFVDKKKLKQIEIKQKVEIIFPDDIQSVGIVEKIFSSAYAFSELEWDDYEPVESRIRIHISPLNHVEASSWKKYDLLRVRVRGGRW